MSVGISQRVQELARRAGFAEVKRPVLIVGILFAVAAISFGVVRWWPGESDAVFLASAQGASAVSSESVPAGAGDQESAEMSSVVQPEPLQIHVVGAVLRPGVYELVQGQRVSDAVAAAGGLLGQAAQEGVNLARSLVDGEQVRIPTQDELVAILGGEEPNSPVVSAEAYTGAGTAVDSPMDDSGTSSAPSVSSGSSAGASALIDVNRATQAQLETLPGIGPSTAAAIIDDRQKIGPFLAVEDLLRVTGIGDAKLAAIRDLVKV
ncbi:MAG: ComEA family DNA-binding protein [Actinomycetota bacterium]|jgi:competence protein ComEA|nr:ComEA family DNA-binding protein [Actinomycetota bacterium]